MLENNYKQAQVEFAWCVGRFLTWCRDSGLNVSFGEAHRPPLMALLNSVGSKTRGAVAAMLRPLLPAAADALVAMGSVTGSAKSLHCDRLAVDFVFRNDAGDVISTPVAAAGYWTGLHPLARAGVFWKKPDPPHFSFAWDGRE